MSSDNLAARAFRLLSPEEQSRILDEAFAEMLRGKTLADLRDLHDRIAAGSGNGLEIVLAEISRRSASRRSVCEEYRAGRVTETTVRPRAGRKPLRIVREIPAGEA